MLTALKHADERGEKSVAGKFHFAKVVQFDVGLVGVADTLFKGFEPVAIEQGKHMLDAGGLQALIARQAGVQAQTPGAVTRAVVVA